MSYRAIDMQFQEAAVDPSLWPRALQSVAAMMGAIGGNLLPFKGHVPNCPCSPSLAEATERYQTDGWIFRDERARGVRKLLKTGTFVDQDVFTPDAMARSPFYRDFLEPLRLRWFVAVGFRASDEIWSLVLQRRPDQGYFTPDEQRTALQFQNSLSRAATMASLRGQVKTDGTLQAFETLNNACFLLDRLGRVMRMTEGARALIGRDVLVVNGSVLPADRERTADVSRMIAAALWADVEPDSPFLQTIALRRKGKRPLLIQAQPLRGEARGSFGSARVALIMTDLGEFRVPSAPLLQRTFSLTAAETRLLLAFFASSDLRAAADACGITYESARTYLKIVLTKTETRKQSELLTLVARLV